MLFNGIGVCVWFVFHAFIGVFVFLVFFKSLQNENHSIQSIFSLSLFRTPFIVPVSHDLQQPEDDVPWSWDKSTPRPR